MKNSKLVITILLVFCVVAAAGIAKKHVDSEITTKLTKINKNFVITQNEICSTESKPVREKGLCKFYYNFTSCFNTTGEKTGCYQDQKMQRFECNDPSVIEYEDVTTCTDINSYTITARFKGQEKTHTLDFSEYGPCKHKIKRGCAIFTCVSKDDGAHKGKFTSCKQGQSCQKIEICKDTIKKSQKNSRTDFVVDDETFKKKRIKVTEVAK